MKDVYSKRLSDLDAKNDIDAKNLDTVVDSDNFIIGLVGF